MDKSLIAALLLFPLTALGQTHTFPGNNVFPSGSTVDFAAGSSVDFTGATVTGVSGGSVSLTATAPVVVTPSPITGTGVISLTVGSSGGVQAWDTDLDTWATKTPYAGTLTITTGKTFNVTNNLTLSGTDGSTLNVGSGGTLGTAAYTASSAYLTTTGDLSPLFTTAESAGNTAFTLSTAAANTVFGNATGSTAAPTFSSSPRFTAIGNLTGNGFVKTSGGVGTLSVDTATYLTANQSISLTGDVTGGPAATSIATTIGANKVTLGMMATMATDSILGRATASTGNVEVLSSLPFAFTGDVTRPVDSNAQTIANSAVTYAKMQNVSANSRLLGSGSAGTGLPPAEITVGSGLTMTGTTLTAAGGGTTFIGLTDVPASYSGANSKVVAVNAGATALEFISAPAAGAGGSTTQVQYNNAGSLAGDADFTWDATNNILTLPSATSDARLKIGTLEFEDYGLANAWISENAYFDGAAWKYRATGAASLFYFQGTEGAFRVFPSGTGGTALPTYFSVGGDKAQLKVNADNTVAIGGVIHSAPSNYLGSLLLVKGASPQIGIAANYALGWSGTSADASATIDTGLSRNTGGVVEVNNGTAGTYRDIKVDEVDAVTGYKLNGTTINLDYSNTSVTNQTPSTSDVYLVGSNIVLPAGGFKANGQYRCLFDVVKSAGTGTIVLTLRIGTAGTTGDTSRITFTFPAGTSVADTGNMEVFVNWRTVGGGTSAVVSGVCRAFKNTITAAGLWNDTSAAKTIVGTVSGGFDSSAATTIGLSFNGGTAFAGTITTVQSNLFQK